MTRREFERVVEEAVDSLPKELRGRLDNVEFHVAESPNRRQAQGLELPSREPSLYGLYEGTSLADRSVSDAVLLPSRITLFKRAIERDFPKRPEMIKCIQETVLHEIGHHFGFDDEDLDGFGIG
jgi:predicted Zn-dependent protease with MMP-like domain